MMANAAIHQQAQLCLVGISIPSVPLFLWAEYTEFALLATSVQSPVTYLQSVLYWLKHTAYRFKPTCPYNITLFNMAAHPSSLSCLIRYFIFISVPWQACVCIHAYKIHISIYSMTVASLHIMSCVDICLHMCVHARYNLVPREKLIRPWVHDSYYTLLYHTTWDVFIYFVLSSEETICVRLYYFFLCKVLHNTFVVYTVYSSAVSLHANAMA